MNSNPLFLLEAHRVEPPDSTRTQDNWPCLCRTGTREQPSANGQRVSERKISEICKWGLIDSLLLCPFPDDYQRGTSSSVSPRGGYCSSASTPHSSNGGGGSYSNANAANAQANSAAAVNGYSNMGAIPSSPASVFNSTSSEYPKGVRGWFSISQF